MFSINPPYLMQWANGIIWYHANQLDMTWSLMQVIAGSKVQCPMTWSLMQVIAGSKIQCPMHSFLCLTFV